MNDIIYELSSCTVAKVQAFADDEDTLSELSFLALGAAKAKEKEEERTKDEEQGGGRKRALTTVNTPGRRRGGTTSVNIGSSLVKLGDKLDADKKTQNSGFRGDEEVFSFHIPLSRTFVQTIRDILAMLLVSTLLSVVSWEYVRQLPSLLVSVTIEDSANEQFGIGNYTLADYGRENCNDIYGGERARRIKQVLSIGCAFSLTGVNAFALFSVELGVPYLYYLTFFAIMAILLSIVK